MDDKEYMEDDFIAPPLSGLKPLKKPKGLNLINVTLTFNKVILDKYKVVTLNPKSYEVEPCDDTHLFKRTVYFKKIFKPKDSINPELNTTGELRFWVKEKDFEKIKPKIIEFFKHQTRELILLVDNLEKMKEVE